MQNFIKKNLIFFNFSLKLISIIYVYSRFFLIWKNKSIFFLKVWIFFFFFFCSWFKPMKISRTKIQVSCLLWPSSFCLLVLWLVSSHPYKRRVTICLWLPTLCPPFLMDLLHPRYSTTGNLQPMQASGLARGRTKNLSCGLFFVCSYATHILEGSQRMTKPHHFMLLT